MREPTSSEMRWWDKLKAHLRSMPKNVELHARSGNLGIAPAGSRLAAMDRTQANFDNTCETEWDTMSVQRLDGRDSHL